MRPPTGPERPEQLALIEGRARYTGRLIPSLIAGTNADLIAAIAPIYLAGTVLDVTYGRGSWWTRYRPDNLTAHDLYTLDGVDFRDLPHPPDSFDTVCFDPPYIPTGGTSGGSAVKDSFRDRFGVRHETGPVNEAAVADLYRSGLAEAARVARSFVLAKCTDYTHNHGFHSGYVTAVTAAAAAGLTLWDAIVLHAGPGPSSNNIARQRRTRRAHSHLLVFRP